MPYPPVQRQAIQKAVIERVRAGATVAAACRGEGFPAVRTFYAWTRRYPALRDELDAALIDGRWRRTRAFDPEKAAELLARVWASDAPLHAILKADPTLPCYQTLERWRRQEPRFDALLSRLLANWKRLRKARRARARCEALTPAIVDHIREGGSLLSASRAPGMPAANTLYRWMAEHPDFAAAVTRACEDREDWYLDRMAGLADAGGGATPALRRATAGLSRQLARLRNRPGTWGQRTRR